MRARLPPPALLPAVLGLALAGCETAGYYGQAIRGHCELTLRQRPIPRLLAAADTPGPLKEKLALVLELRQFAERDLKLPCNGHYLRYADLQRRFVVWNVHATPRFSLEPKTWWFPVAGTVKYRGYFREADARRYAGRLQAKGFETYLAGVEAYSTLGWFRDPVLNTFIHQPAADLADTLFHELAHQRLYVRGDTDFNEALATAVAREGVRRWLAARGSPAERDDYEARLRREEDFTRCVAEARSELHRLYQSTQAQAGGPLNPQELTQREHEFRARLRARYAALKAGWGGHDDYDGWFSGPLNGAQLNTVATYHGLVPGFLRLLESCGGDLDRFFSAARKLGRKSKAQRRLELETDSPAGCLEEKTIAPPR
jgi:predicted aminopeptidase